MSSVLLPVEEAPAASPLPLLEPAPPSPCARGCLRAPRAMTRCECADVEFADVARAVAAGVPLAEVKRRTGCGGLCTGCDRDLERYVAARVPAADARL